MTEQKQKKAYGIPTLQKRQAQGLPVDISQQDTFLALITKATEWKKGGGIQIGCTLFNPDGTKVPHQNGGEEVEIGAPMPLDGPKFTAYTRAIFPEADQFAFDAGFDLEDLLERWVYVKLERDKKRDENEQELAQWGPRLNVTLMTPIPVGERAAIAALHARVVGKPMKTLGGATAAAAPAPQAAPAAPATAAPAAAKSAQAAKTAQTPATVPPGVDPNNPFGV